MNLQEKAWYAERRELEGEIERLKADNERMRGVIIKCGADLLMNRLSEYHSDWPKKMPRKNMEIIMKHNEYLRRKAIQLKPRPR